MTMPQHPQDDTDANSRLCSGHTVTYTFILIGLIALLAMFAIVAAASIPQSWDQESGYIHWDDFENGTVGVQTIDGWDSGTYVGHSFDDDVSLRINSSATDTGRDGTDVEFADDGTAQTVRYPALTAWGVMMSAPNFYVALTGPLNLIAEKTPTKNEVR